MLYLLLWSSSTVGLCVTVYRYSKRSLVYIEEVFVVLRVCWFVGKKNVVRIWFE